MADINRRRKWDMESCKEEAMKYDSRVAFSNGSQSAYQTARRNHWLDEYTWFKPKKKRNFWNEDTCRDEAKKYSSLKRFEKGCGSAYQTARINGWLKDYTWMSSARKWRFWDEDSCREEAMKHKTRTSFAKASPYAHKIAVSSGWIEGYDWMVPSPRGRRTKWNEDTCREESMKYMTRGSFARNSFRAYICALENDWLDSYTWLKAPHSTHPSKWDDASCMAEAKKYSTRTEFANGSSRAYRMSVKNGWIGGYKWLNKKNKNS